MGGDTIAMSTRCTRPFAFTNVPSLPESGAAGSTMSAASVSALRLRAWTMRTLALRSSATNAGSSHFSLKSASAM